MPPKGKSSLSFADLGLSTAVPAALLKTRAEKGEEKFAAKKARQHNTKTAFEQLDAQRGVAERHKAFLQQEADDEKRLRQAQKRQLKGEHIAAQVIREGKDKARDAEFLERQAVVVAERKEVIEQKKIETREAERLIQEEIEAQIKVAKPAVHVTVARTEAIQATRDKLPVLAEEQAIVEAIVENPVVLICGETGSGKTTQIPQFLWEAGFGHEVGTPFGRQGLIAVTEPRRVAAVSMAKRVAEELNEPFGGSVCYHVRYDHNLSSACRMKFMTEGILLKEMQSDFLLRKYSAVVVDEAHERSVACDVLIGLLSRVVGLRRDMADEQQRKIASGVEVPPEGLITPLKVVIMSATMRVSDFRDNTRLFSHTPPLINVEARRFPVTNHFTRKTELFKYINEAFAKIRQIHKKLPPGGILVFLPTQRDIELLCNLLRDFYGKTRIFYESDRYGKHSQLHTRREGHAGSKKSGAATSEAPAPPSLDEFGLDLDDYGLEGDEDGPGEDAQVAPFGGLTDDFDYAQAAAESSEDDDAETRIARAMETIQQSGAKTKRSPKSARVKKIRAEPGPDEGLAENADASESDSADEASGPKVNEEDEEDGAYDTMHVLPLYALLDPHQQQQVFLPPPDGKRLCVVATNVAETSITIPNIRYVVDAGRVKTKVIDESSGASSYRIEWTSQASAEQRSGRAGRTGPGHCYRLFSTALYVNRMPKHATPEILRTPLETVVLMMKHLRIDHVGRFPFPTPPRQEDLRVAMRHLSLLKAIDGGGGKGPVHRITPLGVFLMRFPVPPRFARIIFEVLRTAGTNKKLHSYACSIVAVVATTTDNFRSGGVDHYHSLGEEEQAAVREQQQHQKGLLHGGSDLLTALRVFGVFAAHPTVAQCNRYNVVHKTLTEALQLRKQLEAAVEEARREHDDSANTLANLQESVDAAEGDGRRDGDESEPLAPGSSAQPLCVRYGFGRDGGVALSRDEEVLLRKAFIAGLWDQVARRASVSECTASGFKYNDSKTAKVPYRDARTGNIVYIHPTSAVARSSPPPEFVTYCSMVRTKRKQGDTAEEPGVFLTARESKVVATERTFMKGVTTVTKPWLDQLGFAEEDVADPGAS